MTDTRTIKKEKGFALLIAMVTTSILLLISFVVANIALKQLVLAYSGQESQYAFYNADSGVECALYWDVKHSNVSAFDPGAQSTFADFYISEYSGIDTASPLDKVSNKFGLTSGAENELVSSNPVNTSSAKELIFGWLEEGGNGPVSEGPGFFATSYLRNNVQEYKVVTSAGSYTASGYYANAGHGESDYKADILTFKAASGVTPAKVQSKDNYITMPDPVSLTFDDPSVTGDLIIVSIDYNKDTFPISSITDDKGNRYKRALGPSVWPNSPWASETWYAKNITGGGSPITVTVNSPAFVQQTIHCNGQDITTGSQTVQTNPTKQSLIGGGGAGEPTSIFQLNFTHGCAIVTVNKDQTTGLTTIESRGYNTCDTSSDRRLERAVRVQY